MKTGNQKASSYQAILLVGPTGSGKTPFGAFCEENGIHRRPCIHFDFGAELRRIAACTDMAPGFSCDDLTFIRQVLTEGRLLENEHFHIAKKIIHLFLQEKHRSADSFILLNGLPRHIGQARDMEAIVDVREVICLACRPEVVYDRIRRNTGGDRIGRTDDALNAIQNKLAVFQDRTVPLLEHYRNKGAKITDITIDSDHTAADVHASCSTDDCR